MKTQEITIGSWEIKGREVLIDLETDSDQVPINFSDLLEIIEKYEGVMDELYQYACECRMSRLIADQTFDMIADVIRPEDLPGFPDVDAFGNCYSDADPGL